jgi:hypothetical protein
MKCNEAKKMLSPMLDSMLDGAQFTALTAHLSGCEDCRGQLLSLRRNRQLVAALPPRQAPAELALRLRVAASHHLAQGRRNSWQGALVRWENAINAFMLPAVAGLLSAVLIFGLLIGVLVPARMANVNDVPTSLYTPPELTLAPFGLEGGNVNGEAVLVEALIDSHGRVQDYRLLNAPAGTQVTPAMKNALLFTQFRPATSFGLPTSGRVVLSFSNISVGG